jgi:dolichyl-phosphate beta-glucosyltransferase
MANRTNIHLSVVIPAYNEARRIPRTIDDVLNYLSGQAYASEIIVVDDGSTDNTAEVVRQKAKGNIDLKVLPHPDGLNHGKGAAVKLGMLAARGRYRLFMDADNSTTINHVERFWTATEKGFDVVIGSRGLKDSDITVSQPWYRILAGRAGNRIIQTLAVPGIEDTQAGFKMFTDECAKDVFPRLTIDRWGFDVEALAVARHLGYKIAELPIKWVNDPEGKVTFKGYLSVFGEVWQVRKNLKSGTYGAANESRKKESARWK